MELRRKQVLPCGLPNISLFIDDGLTGVNTNREAFQRLLQLVEEGQIGIVVVKDA